jgi:polysaccharide biosynthesis transport protein
VQTAQFTLREVISLFRRRKKFMILPVIIVTVLCSIGAFMLSNKYESSTTILVQRDNINSLISYEMAMTIASEDRLGTFNEIIYSRTTLLRLIDTLGLGVNAKTEAGRQSLVANVGRNISTERRGSDSFRITYVDTDPYRAERAASLLANLFIQTTIGVEGQRNERAVQFFETKLDELRQKYEASQRQFLVSMRERINTMPTESKTISTQLESIEKQIGDLDTRIQTYKQELQILRTFPDALHTEEGKQSLYDLQRADIPFATDLKTLLIKYDDYLRHYTAKYPEVGIIETQLFALLERMKNALESELSKQQSEHWEYANRRSQLVDNLKQSSINQTVSENVQGDYEMYKKLYDEMKLKLEQAQTARDLGQKGASQFVIIDPAQVPTSPSKPNRIQLILGGFGFGLFLGFITVVLKEMLDTTLRRARDIEIYRKPVIAFITEGNEQDNL